MWEGSALLMMPSVEFYFKPFSYQAFARPGADWHEASDIKCDIKWVDCFHFNREPCIALLSVSANSRMFPIRSTNWDVAVRCKCAILELFVQSVWCFRFLRTFFRHCLDIGRDLFQILPTASCLRSPVSALSASSPHCVLWKHLSQREFRSHQEPSKNLSESPWLAIRSICPSVSLLGVALWDPVERCSKYSSRLIN